MDKIMSSKGVFNNKLSRRVFVYIFLCSAFLSVCSTFIQIYVDFKGGVSALDERFDNIELSFNQSISTSLWDFNEPLVEQQIGGIQRLPDIRHVKITQTGCFNGQKKCALFKPQSVAIRAYVR